MYERFTDRARKVMQLANQEAQRFNHDFVDTAHVLLGISKEGAGVGAHALKGLDIDLRKIRHGLEAVLKPGPEMVTMGKLPQTDACKAAIQRAIREAVALQHNYIGTEHLLLGILHGKQCIACQVLIGLGVTTDAVRGEVIRLLGIQPEAVPEPQEQVKAEAVPSTPAVAWQQTWTFSMSTKGGAARQLPLSRAEVLEELRVLLNQRKDVDETIDVLVRQLAQAPSS